MIVQALAAPVLVAIVAALSWFATRHVESDR